MRSRTPKLLHPLCGRPMIEWSVAAAHEAGAGTIVVVDAPAQPLAELLNGRVVIAVQEQARGTADATRSAAAHIDPESTVSTGCPKTVYWPSDDMWLAMATTMAADASMAISTVMAVEKISSTVRQRPVRAGLASA